MKKLSAMASIAIKRYLSSTNCVCFGEVMNAINSTVKANYNPVEVLNYIVLDFLKELEGEVSFGKLNKYVSLIKEMGIVYKNKGSKGIESEIINNIGMIPAAVKYYYTQHNLEIDEKFYENVSDAVSYYSCTNVEKVEYSVIVDLKNKLAEAEKTNKELDSQLQEKILILNKLNKSGLKSLNAKDETIAKQLKTITELNQEISELKTKNSASISEEQVKQYEELITKKDDSIKSLTENIDSLQTVLDKANSEIETLNEELTKKTNEVRNLKKREKTLKEENEKLILSEELSIGQKEKFYQTIDSLILSLISEDEYTILELQKEVNKKVKVTTSDIRNSLNRLSTKYSIFDRRKITIPQKYHISQLYLDSNRQIVLSSNTVNMKRLLFISDLHLDPNTNLDEFAALISNIQNYAISNNIDTIINLGDFFDIYEKQFGDEVGFKNVNKAYENMLEYFIKNNVFDANINHLLLGGNHDCYFRDFGYNSIERMSLEIPQIIYAGFYDASLFVDKENVFGIHHPFKSDIDLQNKLVLADSLSKYVSDYNNKTGSNAFFDMFGHYHINVIDPNSGFALVPALSTDKLVNSFIQADVYFNENGSINYINFTNCVINNSHINRISEVPVIRQR